MSTAPALVPVLVGREQRVRTVSVWMYNFAELEEDFFSEIRN